MGREITTGVYWFYRGDLDRGAMDLELSLREAVDGAALQAAAERVIRRLPFLKLRPEESQDGTRYLLTENRESFSVLRRPGFLPLDSREAGGFLWSLTYSDNCLYLRVFHGLCDGLGLVGVMRQLLLAYFSAVKKDPLSPELRARRLT